MSVTAASGTSSSSSTSSTSQENHEKQEQQQQQQQEKPSSENNNYHAALTSIPLLKRVLFFFAKSPHRVARFAQVTSSFNETVLDYNLTQTDFYEFFLKSDPRMFWRLSHRLLRFGRLEFVEPCFDVFDKARKRLLAEEKEKKGEEEDEVEEIKTEADGDEEDEEENTGSSPHSRRQKRDKFLTIKHNATCGSLKEQRVHLASSNSFDPRVLKDFILEPGDASSRKELATRAAGDNGQYPPLYFAAKHKALENADRLVYLAGRAGIDWNSQIYRQVVELAMMNDDAEMIRLLIEKGAKFDVKASARLGGGMNSLIALACYHGKMNALKTLVELFMKEHRFDQNIANKILGQSACVGEGGAISAGRYNCLELASMKGRIEVAQFLIEEMKLKPAPHSETKIYRTRRLYGHTCLHICAQNNHLKMLKYLVEKGNICADAINHNKNTVLHLFAVQLNFEGALLAKTIGCKLEQANIYGETCLDLALTKAKNNKSEKSIEFARFLVQVLGFKMPSISVLASPRISHMARRSPPRTLLHWVIQSLNVDAVRFLVDEVCKTPKDRAELIATSAPLNCSPVLCQVASASRNDLHTIEQISMAEIFMQRCQAGVNDRVLKIGNNTKSKYWNYSNVHEQATPLINCGISGNVQFARYLVEHGADPDLAAGSVGTALDCFNKTLNSAYANANQKVKYQEAKAFLTKNNSEVKK